MARGRPGSNFTRPIPFIQSWLQTRKLRSQIAPQLNIGRMGWSRLSGRSARAGSGTVAVVNSPFRARKPSASGGRHSRNCFRIIRHSGTILFQGPQTGATPPVCRPDTWLRAGEPHARQEFLELRVRSDSVPLVIQQERYMHVTFFDSLLQPPQRPLRLPQSGKH